MRVVCNTTPLIALSSIGSLDLLSDIYGEIFIPEAVFREIDHGGGIAVPRLEDKKWIEIIPPDPQRWDESFLRRR